MTKQDKTRTLFAVAIERVVGMHWTASIEYLHADSIAHARILFTAGNSQPLLNRTMKIVAIGPAIGYFVEDNKGMILSAS